jgi:hypothetical protein
MPAELEANILKAIASYREGADSSIRAAAAAFNVPVSTLAAALRALPLV